MELPVDFGNEHKLKLAFSWLTRKGIGRRFPGMPIGWYQAHQCAALDVLQEHAVERLSWDKTTPLLLKTDASGGVSCVIAKVKGASGWKSLGTCKQLFDEADKRARG